MRATPFARQTALLDPDQRDILLVELGDQLCHAPGGFLHYLRLGTLLTSPQLAGLQRARVRRDDYDGDLLSSRVSSLGRFARGLRIPLTARSLPAPRTRIGSDPASSDCNSSDFSSAAAASGSRQPRSLRSRTVAFTTCAVGTTMQLGLTSTGWPAGPGREFPRACRDKIVWGNCVVHGERTTKDTAPRIHMFALLRIWCVSQCAAAEVFASQDPAVAAPL